MAAPKVTGPMLDVLAVLMEAWDEHRDAYGWVIIKAVRRSTPVVYSAIDRLETAGWITGRWEQLAPGETRPRRRLYELTAEGAQVAREWGPSKVSRVTTALRPAFGGAS
jgi:DNA-binding PadR family transcriptional regulator